jgi:ABC-type phosphate transport system substrate-binding protein
MTKRTTTTAAVLSLALLLFLGSNVFAASNPVSVNLTGSSAMFNLSALAGYSASGCGTNIWTQKSTSSAPMGGVDQRPGGAPIQTGNIWIIWNNAETVICSYLTVDSAVGDEMFFAVPKFTISINSTWVGAPGLNLIPTLTDTTLPQAVYTALNNQPFNGAATDVRPEDALFEVDRVLAPLDPVNYTGLGYGPGPVGTPIESSFSSKSATAVAFALTGADPISGGTVPAWTTTPVGAEPVMVFVNTSETGTGHFGNAQFTNVDRWVLADVLNGTLTRTRDIANAAGLPAVGIPVILREPTSGTYTTLEFNVPRNVEINSTQELGVNPSAPGGNPLNITYASGGSRRRAIGTGEMVSEIGSNSDAFGYAFWSTGNFAAVLTDTKYLSVDGVDPLNYSWYQSRGAFPNCVYPCKGLIPFVNILNGSYPIWSILRVATNLPIPSGISNLIKTVQSTASDGFPDIVPYSQMQMFRSHYNRPGQANATSNGHTGEPPEAGGDVGGAVFSIQSDLDFFADTGTQLLQLKN